MTVKKNVPAINNASEIETYLKSYLKNNDKLALFLDYDGTLAAIVANPNLAVMSMEVESILRRLAVNPNILLGIISGRGLQDVKSRVGIENIVYGGNHGIQIENSDGSRSDYELDGQIKEKYQEMVKELNDKVAHHGAWNEDKLVSLTFHYRDVPVELVDDLKSKAIKIIESYGFKANQAHCAIEAKPPVNWNKGEAVRFILNKSFGQDWSDKVKVIFAGDDTTDEDAMKVLQGKGKSFRIANDPNFETYGDYILTNQCLIEQLLESIENVYVN